MSSQISALDQVNDPNISSIPSGEAGLLELKRHVMFNAMHTLSEHQPHQWVHPKTRNTILNSIMDWIKNPDPEHDVLWLHAPVGHGKTAVIHKIVESLHGSSLIDHAGSFFFSRGKDGQDRATYLIPTIAYQTALNIPMMRQHINQAMTQDLLLPWRDIDTQFQCLMLDPFHRCSPPLANKPVVIIDGLDECTGLSDAEHPSTEEAKHIASYKAQLRILDHIVKAVSSPHCPLRFLIASRPESHLTEVFHQQPLCRISRHFELDGEVINSSGNRIEMMEFLRDGFDDICHRFSNVMSTVEKPWPGNDDLWELVRKASGQYLFATSVLQFVESGPEPPANKLKIIIKQRHRESGRAFAAMDQSYTRILKACPEPRRLQLILDICAYFHAWEDTLTSSTLAEISDCAEEDVILSLLGLNSLLDVDEFDDIPADISTAIQLRYYSPYVRVRHISFVDFLLDKERSLGFHVNVDAVRVWLMERADILLADGLSGRARSLLHRTTLKLIACLAAADSGSDDHINNDHAGIDFSHFPRLLQFLKMISQPAFLIPDKPGKRFVESILTVLSVFDMLRHREVFKKYIPLCNDLLDQAWRKTIFFSPRLHKIIYTILTHPNLCPHISVISNTLGTPLHETLDMLDQYSCFSILGHKVELLDSFRSFAETECRSGSFHFHYRECWISAISAHWREVLKEVPRFSLNSYGYQQVIEGFYEQATISDINFGSDLQEDAAMNDLSDFVLRIASGGVSIIGENDYSVDIICLFIRWLVRQQKILRSADEKFSNIARKLKGIVKTIDWNRLIYGVFSTSLHPAQDATLVPPLGIERISRYNRRTRRAVKFYSCMSQLANSTADPLKEDAISAVSHATISAFFLHALFARECHNVGIDEWRTFYVPIIINVKWHYHLSHAMFNEKILFGLLTVHHIFIQREDPTVANQERLALDTMKQLSKTSFSDGVVAWLKSHTREDNNNLEWWAKGIPGMKQGNRSDNTAFLGNHRSASDKPGTSKNGKLSSTPTIKSKRKTPGTSTSKAAGAQVNVPSSLTTTTHDDDSEPIAKRLRTITRPPKQASRRT